MPPLIQAEGTFQTDSFSQNSLRHCGCVVVFAENKIAKQSKVYWFFPSIQQYPPLTLHRHCTAQRQYTGWWKQGWPCDLWSLCCMCQTALTAASRNIARFWFFPVSTLVSLDLQYFKFSSQLYMFLSHWCIIYSIHCCLRWFYITL